DVLVADRARQHRGLEPREGGDRHLGTHAAHRDEQLEHAPLLERGEAEQHVRILAHHLVGMEVDLLAFPGQRVERVRRDVHQVAHARHVDHARSPLDPGQRAAQRGDHHALCGPGSGASSRWAAAEAARLGAEMRARWRWQSAHASASAASGVSAAERLSSRRTMNATCSLAAAPLPVTLILISRGLYSATAIPRWTAATSSAPRTCPSARVERALSW